MIHLFISADPEGNIIKSFAGKDIVPPEEYHAYFEYETWDIPNSIDRYKLVNGELVLTEAPAE